MEIGKKIPTESKKGEKFDKEITGRTERHKD
jgi:hypothetical protein